MKNGFHTTMSNAIVQGGDKDKCAQTTTEAEFHGRMVILCGIVDHYSFRVLKGQLNAQKLRRIHKSLDKDSSAIISKKKIFPS